MNPKVIALIALVCAVSAGTFWATREYTEFHPIATDSVNVGS
ncbi:MAG TPA: hypothetical protein VHD38_03135 [Candidatus Paceibacterota bacterium]|jgi:hypothetical protein|nr:hypothetical protein [Candidatus Paceibacterota bacterium]